MSCYTGGDWVHDNSIIDAYQNINKVENDSMVVGVAGNMLGWVVVVWILWYGDIERVKLKWKENWMNGRSLRSFLSQDSLLLHIYCFLHCYYHSCFVFVTVSDVDTMDSLIMTAQSPTFFVSCLFFYMCISFLSIILILLMTIIQFSWNKRRLILFDANIKVT